jgi:probable rRNA maturation factor
MIKFNNIKTGFNFNDPVFFRNWLKLIIKEETKNKLGEIQYIFCDDKVLYKINKTFLNHQNLTDIITFPSYKEDKKVISGEIYISIDRVKENAKKFKTSFQNEFSRVLVHGLLHLLGFNDQTSFEKVKMRQKEDYYLNLRSSKIS